MTELRILVSAYGCEPGKGSEQGVGWNWTLQLARFAHLVVLTRSNNRDAIEAALPEQLRSRVTFVYHDLPPALRRLKRKERGLYPYYLLWQWGVYRRAQSLVAQSHFDYVVALTFGSLWMPTFMHRLTVPFIWGPIGGGEAVPSGMISSLGWKARIPQYLRYILMATAGFNPVLAGPLKKARWILARTADTAHVIPARHSSKVRVVLETAVSEELLSFGDKRDLDHGDGPLRVIYTGRLIGLKNVATAVMAVAKVIQAGTPMDLVLVGDGPERTRLERLAASLNIAGSVHFLGTRTQAEVMAELVRSDVYLFPSLKEGGVWSLMEAMAVGLPVICIATSGMAVITDDTCALRATPGTQEQLVDSFADALTQLASSPETRSEMGRRARLRIRQNFLWQHKGEMIQALLAVPPTTAS